MIYVAKIFALILGTTVISKTYLDFQRKRESIIMFLFWSVTWIAIIVISLFPTIIEKTIATIGLHKTGTGTFFGMALVFLFFVIYRVYTKANKIEKDIVEIVEKLGIQNMRK